MTSRESNSPIKVPRPITSRRVTATIVPNFPKEHLKARIPRSREGLQGIYTATFALAVPGKNTFHADVHLDCLKKYGESLIKLTEVNEVKLYDGLIESIKDAYIYTDSTGFLKQIRLTVEASCFRDAELEAYNFAMPFLSWLSYYADVAVDISACELYEEKTDSRQFKFNCLSDYKKFTWQPSDGLNIQYIPKNIRILLSAYREAMNATNPFYKFLCFWKIIEGCQANRKMRDRKYKRSGKKIPPLAKKEAVPSSQSSLEIHKDDCIMFLPYLGGDFTDICKGMEDDLRNAIAHLIPSRNILDPDNYIDITKCEAVIPIVKYMAYKMLANEIATENKTKLSGHQ